MTHERVQPQDRDIRKKCASWARNSAESSEVQKRSPSFDVCDTASLGSRLRPSHGRELVDDALFHPAFPTDPKPAAGTIWLVCCLSTKYISLTALYGFLGWCEALMGGSVTWTSSSWRAIGPYETKSEGAIRGTVLPGTGSKLESRRVTLVKAGRALGDDKLLITYDVSSQKYTYTCLHLLDAAATSHEA